MAKKTLSSIRAIIRQLLLDELGGDGLEFEEDELDIHIGVCLAEISERSSYQKRETLPILVTGSRELDISSIEDLVKDIEEVEYPVGQKRTCSTFGDTLTIETDLSPVAGEAVYLYCNKLHQLTESSSTLKPQQERVLILGVSGKAAIAKARTLINKINLGGARTPAEMQSWGVGQLALYRAGLNEIPEPPVWPDHPRG